MLIGLFHCCCFPTWRLVAGLFSEPFVYKDFSTDEDPEAVEIYFAQCKYETDGYGLDGVSDWYFQRGDCNFAGVADVRNSSDEFEVEQSELLLNRI